MLRVHLLFDIKNIKTLLDSAACNQYLSETVKDNLLIWFVFIQEEIFPNRVFLGGLDRKVIFEPYSMIFMNSISLSVLIFDRYFNFL